MLAAFWVLLALAPAQVLTLYVGPQIKDASWTSTREWSTPSPISRSSSPAPACACFVATEAEATIKLYVLSRERFATGDSFSTGTGVAVAPGVATGSGVSIGVDAMRVHSRLKVGNDERALAGEGSGQEGSAGGRQGRADLGGGQPLTPGGGSRGTLIADIMWDELVFAAGLAGTNPYSSSR